MVWVWLVLAVALVFVELHHLAFYAMFVAVGAAGAALAAAVAPSAFVLQGAVFVAVTVAGVVGVRPYVSRVYERRHRGGTAFLGVHGGLVGQQAVTLDDVGDAHHVGHVRLAGERWLAIRGGGAMIPPNTPVLVTAVQGTTLIVWPIDQVEEGRLS